MEVTLALLADYANVSQEGKLNVMGVFGRIFARQFPVIHPSCVLVMRFTAGPAEKGTTKQIEVMLLEADGEPRIHLSTSLQVPAETPGLSWEMNQLVNLQMMQFDKPGDYAFHILVGGETKGTVPFVVEQLGAG